MSKRVYADENGTPRQLVEVPMPMNGPPRQAQQQPFPFNQGNNNVPPYNNSNDAYAMVPRVGSKKKTIIIKDEKGNEISRIVSSTGRDSRPPMTDSLVSRNNYVAPYQPATLAPATLQPAPSAVSGLVLQPQQYLLQPAGAQAMTPVPLIVQPQYSANPYLDPNNMNRNSLVQQTIPEENITSARRSKRTSAQYRTLEKAREIKTAKDREKEFKDLRRKLDDDMSLMSDDRVTPVGKKMIDRRDHIFCCAFCEKANTDTCAYCWRLCGFPTWFATLIGLIFLVIVAALAVIIGLYAGKILT